MYRKLLFVVAFAILLGAFVPSLSRAQVMEGRRDPMIYGLASFVVPGLGQYLNGEPDKALVHFLVAVSIPTVGYTVAYYMFFSTYNPALYYLIPLLQLGWAAYSAIDAYETAERYNREHGFSLLRLDFSLGG